MYSSLFKNSSLEGVFCCGCFDILKGQNKYCEKCIKGEKTNIKRKISNLRRLPNILKNNSKICCHQCNQMMLLKDLKNHLDSCLIKCNDGCGLFIKGSQQNEHRFKFCKNARISCIGYPLCQKKDKRINVLYHQLNCENIDRMKKIVYPLYSRLIYFLVGIGKYITLEKLNGSINDAKEMKDCVERIGYEQNEENIVLDEEATKSNLLKNLDRIKQELEGKDDNERILNSQSMFLFYFSGHGIKDEEGSYYICPQDYQSDSKQSAIDIQFLIEFFSNINCKHVLLILDCCHSGGIFYNR